MAGSVELLEEVALAVACGGITHAVMMVTPTQLDDFAFGFCFGEGLIKHAREIHDWQFREENNGWQMDVTLSAERMAEFRLRQRRLKGSSGCGLCGSAALDIAVPELSALAAAAVPAAELLVTLREKLAAAQTLGPRTGAVHAAMLMSASGEVIACREDIGRHNALDKLVGVALRQGLDLHGCMVVMSSRCSSELILKTVRAGVSVLINLSAPSTLAVRLARRYGLHLLHLTQDGSVRVFA